MRQELGKILGVRKRFSATFERDGKKKAYRGYGTDGKGFDDTVLFKDVKDETGRIVADHLWFNLTNEFRWAGMNPGDVVFFDARVDDYTKGYERDSYDYKLSRPTKVENTGPAKK